MNCPICGGELVELGGLGNLMWYRCRDCGMEWNQTGPAETVEEQKLSQTEHDHEDV